MARRRFDLKVELLIIRLSFGIPAASTFVKRRRAIPTFGYRQAPCHRNRLRGTRNRLRCAEAARKQHNRMRALLLAFRSKTRYGYRGTHHTAPVPVSCFSCATKVAFVSRAADADRRSRRRDNDGRRSPETDKPNEAKGTTPRPSGHGVVAPSQTAFAARQMRRAFVVARSAPTYPTARIEN